MSGSEDGGFLSRWARRKAQARDQAQARSEAQTRGEAQTRRESPAEVVAPGVVWADAAPPGTVTATVPKPSIAAERHAADDAPATPAAGSAEATRQDAPLPTLADVAKLTRQSDYSPFVQPGVSAEVRNAALKQLFSDPHFNVMDGLDTYIDDYGKPDPIPLAMLRRLHQSRVLGLFDAETEQDGARAGASSDGGAAEAVAESEPSIRPVAIPGPPVRPDDDSDLRLQQDDGAERAGPAPGARS